MEARDRLLGVWFERVRSGHVRLPRFQRHEAWTHQEISALLETVIRGLPAGAALILEVGAEEQFASRMMQGVGLEPTERPIEHLLDGQQRITALFRAFHSDYPDRTYYLTRVPDEEGALQETVVGVARWARDGKRYPMWADDARSVYEKNLIPIELLRPEDVGIELFDWCETAAGRGTEANRDLQIRISALRDTIRTYNVPFLALPSSTPKEVALDVFIKLNTSNVKLTPFDIIVAQLEERTGASLHDLVADLRAGVPDLSRYANPSDVILDVAALRENRTPSRASYFKLDLSRMYAEWDAIVDGLKFAVRTLTDERVFDAERLPTVTVLPLLAALHADLPAALDAAGNARSLVRAYLWRAFCTNRYESSTGTRALQDLRGLREEIAGKPRSAPILDEELHPLPTIDDLLRAPWPKTASVLGRGVLAASLRAGGLDLADGESATADSVLRREYHHLFPDSLLTGFCGLNSGRSYRALNCALITWNTNRAISAKEPLAYLRERAERATLENTRFAIGLVRISCLTSSSPRRAAIRARTRPRYRRGSKRITTPSWRPEPNSSCQM